MNQDPNKMPQTDEPSDEEMRELLDRFEEEHLAEITRKLLAGPTVGEVAAERGSTPEGEEVNAIIAPDVPMAAALMFMRENDCPVAGVRVDEDNYTITLAELESSAEDMITTWPEGDRLYLSFDRTDIPPMIHALRKWAKGLGYEYVCLGEEEHSIYSLDANLQSCTKSAASHKSNKKPGVRRLTP